MTSHHIRVDGTLNFERIGLSHAPYRELNPLLFASVLGAVSIEYLFEGVLWEVLSPYLLVPWICEILSVNGNIPH